MAELMNITPTGKWGKKRDAEMTMLGRSFNPMRREVTRLTFRVGDQIMILSRVECDVIANALTRKWGE